MNCKDVHDLSMDMCCVILNRHELQGYLGTDNYKFDLHGHGGGILLTSIDYARILE
jgi:hypothetical protein